MFGLAVTCFGSMFHLRDFEDRFRLQLWESTVIGFVV